MFPRLASLLTRARPYLVVELVVVLVVTSWFRSGTFIATGDIGPFIRRGWAPEATWSWNHSVTGAGSASFPVARALEFGLVAAARSVGLDEYAAQWMFYLCVYSLVGLGMTFLAGAFVRGELAMITSGVFGIVNGFFLTRLPNPLNIISVGTIALVTGLAMRVALGRRIPPVVGALALLPTSFLAFNPPMLVVAYAWSVGGTTALALILFGRRALGRVVWWVARAGPWAVLVNLWWLVPLAQSYTGGGGAVANADFTDPTNWTWAQINNRIHNIMTLVANWAWYRPQYLPFAADLDRPWWVWVRYLLPALVLLAPVVAGRGLRRPALGLLGVVAVVTVLAKGLMPPLPSLNLWLYLHVPGFWLFREPMSKLGQLLVCCYALLLAIFVHGVLDRLRERRGAARASWRGSVTGLVAAGATVAAVAYPYPLWTGSVIPDSRPNQPSAHVRVPDYWWRMAQTIDADPRPGKVLVLPADDYYQMPTTWAFFGVDSIANLLIRHPVVAPKPSGYFGDVAGFSAAVHGVETALVSGDLLAVPRLLHALGVAKVIVRHDLVRGLPGRSFTDDRVISAAIAKVAGMSRLVTGPLELWEAPGPGGAPVRTYSGALDAPADPNAGAAAVATVDTTTAVAVRATKTLAKPGTLDTSVSVTPDVVYWPVPAVDSGSPSTGVTLPSGRFRVAQRARAPATLVPSVRDGQLVLADPTSVLLDGSVVSARPELRIGLPRPDAVVVAASGRAVSLDGWGRADLPHPDGVPPAPASVVVGSATRLRAFAPSVEPARPLPYSEVYDCDNYEPRSARELGLRLDRRADTVRLTALDHAACTRVEIPDAVPGRTYRVRMWYRTLTGKRPQICLTQPGIDGCALTARQKLSPAWQPYEVVTTVEPNAGGLQVVLHADVGERLLGRTVTEYRGLEVTALDQILDTTVFPPEVPETVVDVAGGAHVLSVVGGPAGSVLSGFEPLQDCFRYDDLTPEQADLMAEEQISGIHTDYVLGARDHLACIGSPAPDMGNAALYELRLQARKLELRDPTWCVYLRGPDRCVPLPSGGPYTDWFAYSAEVRPDPAAAETRLYLYGRRDLVGQRQARVAYRDVDLRPLATSSAVVFTREYDWPAPPPVTASPAGPALFSGTMSSATMSGGTGTVVLALAETVAPGWALGGAPPGTKITVQGWMNAWRVPAGAGPVPFTMTYRPARIARYALYSAPVAALAAMGSVWLHRRRWSPRWRRWRRL